MSNDNISFIGIGRIRDQLVLGSIYDRISSQEKNEIETTFQNYLLDAMSRFGAGSRKKRHFSEGTLFMVADREMCCIYAVSCKGKSYPERVAYALLGEVVQACQQPDVGNLNAVERAGSLNRGLRKPLKDLMDKYDKPANVDKVSDVQGKVDNVKGIMQDNINKVLANNANLEELETKTDNLNTNAAQFQRNAGDLRKVMWWRKTKVTVMLIIVAAAIIAYIVLMIVNLVN